MATPHRTRVVCGIDLSGNHEAAVREACALAGPNGHVALVCVLAPGGHASLGALAGMRLERAMHQARAARVASSAYVIRSTQAAAVVLRAAADGDAVVVGAHRWPSAI